MHIKNTDVNYSAIVCRVHNLLNLDELDNLKGFPFQGMHCLVGKDVQVGDMGIIFPAECQLSKDFCKENNLYRHSELNKDPEKAGYIEDNRRVRAVKFRGHSSTALFMPISSLQYLGISLDDLKEGDSFTSINDKEVCKKYVIKEHSKAANKTRGQTKKFTRITNKTFPEHWDTDNYWRNQHKYKDNDEVIITQKLHGCQARFTNARVLRKLSWYEKALQWCGIKIEEYEWDCLAGSRRVIKDTKAEKNLVHYYDEDVWNATLEEIAHLIPKNWILYGELIGWSGDSPIQKNYTYQTPKGEKQFYVYRITVVNENGIVVDLSWDQIKEFCVNNGLKHVPELWRGLHSEFNTDDWMNISYYEKGYKALPLDKKSPCDEGVCVRREGLTPYVTKAKCPDFLLHETKQLDSGQSDLESEES